MTVDQFEPLRKLVAHQITLGDFFTLTNDPSLDKYKMSRVDFFSSSMVSESIKQHELKHASIYDREGILVEFYYFPNKDHAATTANEESIKEWLKDKDTDQFLRLMREVVHAPGSDMGPTDRELSKILGK